jgi:hypothetical protein
MWNLLMSAAVFVVLLVAGLSALFVLGPQRPGTLRSTRSVAPAAGAATELSGAHL